jgi:hypothetical protein
MDERRLVVPQDVKMPRTVFVNNKNTLSFFYFAPIVTVQWERI